MELKFLMILCYIKTFTDLGIQLLRNLHLMIENTDCISIDKKKESHNMSNMILKVNILLNKKQVMLDYVLIAKKSNKN